jgi:hypothetical protein
LKARIEGQIESELIQVELQASILIAHENVHSVQAKVGILTIQAKIGPNCQIR